MPNNVYTALPSLACIVLYERPLKTILTKMKYKNILILAFLTSFAACKNDKEVSHDKTGYIEINDSKHFYQITGTGDTLIILHGGPGLSHQYMKPQLSQYLSSNFTLLYYDQRGSGWSDGENDTTKLNMESFVQDLDGIRNHFNIDKVNLLGHSFGGLLAMHYAIEYPGKVNSLILVDTDAASYELRTPYQRKMINSRISETQEEYLDSLSETTAFKNHDPSTYDKYYKTFLTSYFANPLDTVNLTLGFDSISVPKIRITGRYVRANLGKYDIHDQLSKINCRTLIMQGTESVFSVEGAIAIHQRIPNSEIHLFEKCGHFQYIEYPNKFKDLIFDFYKT